MMKLGPVTFVRTIFIDHHRPWSIGQVILSRCQVNSIKNVLATETRARISGDDDNSRRLQHVAMLQPLRSHRQATHRFLDSENGRHETECWSVGRLQIMEHKQTDLEQFCRELMCVFFP